MNSKQIFKLPIIPEDSETIINYYQLQDECRKKAIIYELKQKQLTIQLQLSKISKELQDHMISNSAAKLRLTETLVQLLKKQTIMYSLENDNKCAAIYTHLAELNKMPKDTETLATKAMKLSDEINAISKQISYLETGVNIHF